VPSVPWGAPATAHAPVGAAARAELPAVAGRTMPTAPASPPSAGPYFDWGLAYIIYGPNDDATHFMGEGAAMVVDDRLGNITVFGGEGTGGLTNWTVNYNVSTGEFFVTVPTPSPTARTNASFAAVPGEDYAVLFGGRTDLAPSRVANDTWIYYFANASWRNVTHGLAPPARESAAFAVNGSGGSALLEGGWNPAYSVNGSTAAVLWNDTWTLNLTSFTWTPVTGGPAPAPAFGAGLLWQNRTDRYELFGGCGLYCYGTLWSYGGRPARWSASNGAGAPSGRAGASWVWDPGDRLAILFGGFDSGTQGPRPLGDGYLYDPSTGSWSTLNAGGGPGPRFDAPNAWAQFPGCVGLNLLGGNIALDGPPQNASVLEPLGAPQPNCFPDLLTGGGGPPPPPCSSTPVPLSVYVYDNYTDGPIPGASVNLDGGCVHRTVVTGPDGYANVTIPTPVRLNVTATADGYRSNELLRSLFLPGSTNFVALGLGPLPTLRVRTYGLDGGGNVRPLDGVTLYQGSTLRLGASDANGYLNVSHLVVPGGAFTLVGTRADFSTATAPVVVPYSGPVFANLTLLAAGNVALEFVDAGDGRLVPNVTATLQGIDPGGALPVELTVGPSGWYNLTPLVAGNYSLASRAPGYLANRTVFFHPWLNATLVVVPLVAEQGATLRVVVRDAVTGLPIRGAQVAVGGHLEQNTTAAGGALFTNVRPPGLYPVDVGATGYRSNESWVRLDYLQVIDPYTVRLTPLPRCPSEGCGPAGITNGTGFAYLPTGGIGTAVLVAAPLALIAAGAGFLAGSRARPARRPAGPRPPRLAPREGER
jgi:hypothetical protein